MDLDINWLIGLHIPSSLLPVQLIWFSNIMFSIVVLLACYMARWKILFREPEQQHVFLGAIVLLLFIWGIKAGISPGLGFHHLGATLFTLMFGWQLAVIGLSVTLVASLLLATPDLVSIGINGVLSIAIPIGVSLGIFRFSQKWLPDNFFIYIFICAFFGAGLAVAASRLSAMGVLSAINAYPNEKLIEESLQYLPMFMFPEAFVTGMLMTAFVVYRPAWVVTFDDDRYLKGK